VAAAMLAGCGGSQPPIGAPGAMPQSAATASAAIARPCIYLLSTSQASNLSYSQIHARKCYIYINDTANMSYSTITAASILYAGAPPNEMGARFPEATPAPGPVVSDPCRTIRGCKYLTNHPPVTSGCSPGNFNGNGQTIGGPGQVTCFSNLTISGQNETVCGLIEITGIQLHLNNSGITSCSSGVTFAMSSNTSDTNFSNATLNLAAPTTGKTRGVVLWRNLAQTNSVNLSSGTFKFTGLLYFPTTPVDYTDTGCNYQLLIFGQANLSSSERHCFPP
jgi:hypothetical protein